jgi:hypothetical protein
VGLGSGLGSECGYGFRSGFGFVGLGSSLGSDLWV